ncbi:unnamed protein product [Adineta steineri]|uniref:PDZ domain-containing protein n=1 Tax=Adineta steineri TaxID=433720 RepID=A0A819UTB2_9BILA|nr:unnamed protein product [Adineta steineri]CAF4100261.1 unnamed protein product [Adineta steineri]
MSDIIRYDYNDHWKEKEITLERTNSSHGSLGFTITGGIDLPFINHHFNFIIITKIAGNGLAYRNKQLKLYDIILRVNNIDFTNIKHQTAADILRASGKKMQLLIRRLAPLYSEEIELKHSGKLGIYIKGGIGDEYFVNDHGIFITDIAQYQTNKQLDIGDRLLQISSAFNTYDLRFVTFEYAKKYIRLACTESQTIKLYVAHKRHTERVQIQQTVLYQGQYDHLGSNDGNYPRYENRLLNSRDINRSAGFLPKERSQPNPIGSVITQPEINRQEIQKSQNLKQPVDSTDPNAAIEQETTQQSKLREAAIRDAHEERIRREIGKMDQVARKNKDGTSGGLRWQID